MERSCSCAAVQIFSAEVCMFLSQKPDFRAFIHLANFRTFFAPPDPAWVRLTAAHPIKPTSSIEGSVFLKFHLKHKSLKMNNLYAQSEPGLAVRFPTPHS